MMMPRANTREGLVSEAQAALGARAAVARPPGDGPGLMPPSVAPQTMKTGRAVAGPCGARVSSPAAGPMAQRHEPSVSGCRVARAAGEDTRAPVYPVSVASCIPGPGRAFTIVEIMLAIAIFSMVISAIYASWSAILRASRVGADAAAEVQRSRVAARTLEDALLSAVLFASNGRLYYFEGDGREDFAWLSFVGRLPPSFPGSGYFGDQVVRRITFSVEGTQDGVNQLLLRQMPLLQTNVDENEDYTIVLARDVKLFGLEFWDARRNDWTDQWVTTNQLPKLVRYALAFGPAALATRPEDVTVRVVSLPSSVVPPDAQMGRGAGPGGPRAPGGLAPPGGAPPPGGVGLPGGQQLGAGQGWNQNDWRWPGQGQSAPVRGGGLERPQRLGGR